MPPAALMSATACSAPFLNCEPKAAADPVRGAPTPILTWALAGQASPRPEASANPTIHTFVMIIVVFGSVVFFVMEFTPITEHLATKDFALVDMRRDCPLLILLS